MEQFDLIVIGGGPGGYLCAQRAAENGMRTALFEARALGGTCLNEGCVPTKSLLYCGKQFSAALHGAAYGVTCGEPSFDHDAAVARKDKAVRMLVGGVAATMRQHGVSVIQAAARLLEKDGDLFAVEAGGQIYHAEKIVLASGSSAVIPPIPGAKEGMEDGFVVTSKELLDWTEAPESLICIGGGVIGLELACYFAEIGTEVTVIEMMPKIAGNTDDEICGVLMKQYQKNGMQFYLNAKVEEIGDGTVVFTDPAGTHTVEGDCILLSTGRRANTASLNLEALGIRTERGAIVTDEHLCTNVPGVYAIGDCNGKVMLAHTAYREAEVAVNHMLGREDKIDYSLIPSVIYTAPEVACIGETEQTAAQKGMDVKVVKVPMMYSGRYVAETLKGDGFCKLLYDRAEDRLAGVQMIGSYSSEIICGAAVMIASRLPLDALRRIVFPHPTVCEVLREGLFML